MNSKFNWGIIGAGWIAEKFATALSSLENANLYAIASRSVEKAQQFAANFKVENAYGTYLELIQNPLVDVIYIATPHISHFELTMLCLENGKAVLCEKPFAMNENQVRRMIAKSQEKQVFLMEAMWTRFLPIILKAKDLIDSGAIGEIKLIQSDFGFNTKFDPNSRLFNKELGGGTLLDIGIYSLFISLFLMGEPIEIKAIAQIGQTEVDEACAMILKYKSGAIASLNSSFLTNTPIITEIFGTKGSIKLNRMWFMPTSMIFINEDGKEEVYEQEFLCNGYEYEAIAVMESLSKGEIENSIMTFNFSLKLISLLDKVRQIIGLSYPAHDL